MKVVLFDYIFEKGKPGSTGLSDVVWSWATHLVAFGDEVHLVGPYAEHANVPEGVTVHRFAPAPIGYRNILGHIIIILRGWHAIRRIGPVDILHAPEYLSTAIFGLLLRNTRIVLTVPGNIYERIANGNPFDWSTTQILKVAAHLSARLCAHIIAISADQKWWWVRTGAKPEQITVLPYGIDTSLFRYIPNARCSVGISQDTRIVLFVGRLSGEKGVDDLIEAVARIHTSHPKIQVHIVGDGPQKERLATIIDRLGLQHLVTWHGWVSKQRLALLYSAADVCVVPSLSEPMGRVVLEAMACGCLVLGSAIGGIVDHIRDGETGFLFPAGNEEELANKLRHILDNNGERTRIANNGNSYLVENLTWEAIVRKMREQIYLCGT